MIFDDKYSLPKPNGATDWLDSPVISGLMLLTEHPEAHKIKSENYFKNGKYVRYPDSSTLDMSRDNAVGALASLLKQGHSDLVSLSYIDGKDVYSPSVRLHERICQGKNPTWFQKQFLKCDIIWNSKFNSVEVETNQLWIICLTAGKEFVKMYCDWDKDWREAIRVYWCGWRQESELAEHMIKYIEGRINE